MESRAESGRDRPIPHEYARQGQGEKAGGVWRIKRVHSRGKLSATAVAGQEVAQTTVNLFGRWKWLSPDRSRRWSRA